LSELPALLIFGTSGEVKSEGRKFKEEDAVFLSTSSKGVRRLSLVAGFLAAGYGLSYFQSVYFGPERHSEAVFINWLNIAFLAGSFFVGAWVIVRMIAWVVVGFLEDRK
jgi:hypothetical protein